MPRPQVLPLPPGLRCGQAPHLVFFQSRRCSCALVHPRFAAVEGSAARPSHSHGTADPCRASRDHATHRYLNQEEGGQHSPGYLSCWQMCYLLMKDCSAQSHFLLILVEGRKGYMPLLLVCFSPSDFSFVMLQRQAVGNNLENHYYLAPVFTGT